MIVLDSQAHYWKWRCIRGSQRPLFGKCRNKTEHTSSKAGSPIILSRKVSLLVGGVLIGRLKRQLVWYVFEVKACFTAYPFLHVLSTPFRLNLKISKSDLFSKVLTDNTFKRCETFMLFWRAEWSSEMESVQFFSTFFYWQEKCIKDNALADMA